MSVKKIKNNNNSAFGLKQSGLYWMLAEGVLEYAVVSGLVILEQSGQSSFSGLLASSCLVEQIDLCCKLLNVM